ncbi:TRAP-type C4-dicarboxylate transport system, small permease component [Rhizobium sp. RU35A]|uniref:TRAP transporter small permease protein n=1 Tax=Rhizobium straminoryzae TaxID=1387186 RepID=A0A549TC18_9HYPH|nr:MULTISPECIES: TRAP transporter small permease [Rhizobium]TRL39437.1 TRAP transporter small permease [Rhizobium straminoryzae]SIP96520.1 TRAP-type C4-dicarboxylate transport system, small permease component [Rhizobium sp. RU35A]
MTRGSASAFDALDRFVHRLAGALVGFSGLCLLAACVLTGVSIIGSLTLRPVPGEIELVEALCGLAVFGFLPFCQLKRGHVGVDLLIASFGPKAMNATQLIGDIVIAVLFALIAWRHGIGLMDKLDNGETTPLLLLPIWWGYALAMILLVVNVFICLFIILADIRDIRRKAVIVSAMGAH